jgi:tRNA pseudouridine32 synthase / 23S rRNA pseudouridine746 synthase
MEQPDCLIPFGDPTAGWEPPERFTFPFYYEPHPLALKAAAELQVRLAQAQGWQHDFGLEGNPDGLGKMFGVLVVADTEGKLGYLAAFSGKLAGTNHIPGFVPPVFDMLDEASFYRKEEALISDINAQIAQLEQDPAFVKALHHYQTQQATAEHAITAARQADKAAKQQRDQQRLAAAALPAEAQQALDAELNRLSAMYHFHLKDVNRHWKAEVAAAAADWQPFQAALEQLKEERRARSGRLQQQLFDQYTFLNQAGVPKSIRAIFQPPLPLPSGAGECAAPKLLQYAFKYHLRPLCMAEFWWGVSPASEVRRHGHFYPACRGKCEPILSHMLDGMVLDPNPLTQNPAADKSLPVVFEDEYLIVVNKPADFFSVPGKTIEDSVAARLRVQFPDATSPMLVHRLDAGTSGLLLAAKNKSVHQHLQAQFVERSIEKRYVALLLGSVEGDSGTISLPLRVDLDDRPRQLVCFEHGKPATTRWQVVQRSAQQTRIYFFPLTGRTHQLRVHAAHVQGLNCPIVGDELYGQKSDRLYLHAEQLAFTHPMTGERMTLEVPAPF